MWMIITRCISSNNNMGQILLLPFMFFMTSCSVDNEGFWDPSDSGIAVPHRDTVDIFEIHPRIMLLTGEEENIRKSLEADPYRRNMHEAIIARSNSFISMPVLERDMGLPMLNVSREAMRRIFYLSYSFRITGDDSYFRRAESEMLAAAGFRDWNPAHFLDVAEMTMAMSIGYDWLFNELSPESRAIIRDAILKKGLEPSFNSKYNAFLSESHSWNLPCNTAMAFGAIAIYEDFPDLSRKVIERTFNFLPAALEKYKPDGVYPEGYSYWGSGNSLNVMLFSAVDKIWPGRINYTEYSAFMQTGAFRKNMITPGLNGFNWGDNEATGTIAPAMHWFAEKNNQPSLLWKEKMLLNNYNFSRWTGNRLLPNIMIWGKELVIAEIPEPDYNIYVAQGPVSVSVMRTSWSDPEAIYLGFKGGSPAIHHGHMDIASFILEADGVRWASDPGYPEYGLVEANGLNLWDYSQNGDRWKVLRNNNFIHNTLTVNGELQRADGYAQIDKHSDNPQFYFVISDISSLYATQLASISRGAGIVDREYVIIRDELINNSQQATIRWQMLTEANVTITGNNSATLTKDGKKLYLRVDSPADVKIVTWSVQSTKIYDDPNPGTIMVGFEVPVPPHASESINVKLIPGSSDTKATQNKRLTEW
jgi:hypothetical protein